MTESEFEIFDGYVRITDKKLYVDTSPVEGLKRTYRRNRLSFTLFVVLWISLFFFLFFTHGIFTIVHKITYIIANLLWLLAIASNKLSTILGRKHAVCLSKKSIKRAEYDYIRSIGTSRVKIFYSNENEDEESRSVLVTLLGRGEEDRLSNAISVLNSEGIETNVGIYYTDDDSFDAAT